MALFKYKAMDEMGKIHRGKIQASNSLEVESRLEKQHYDLLICSEVSASFFKLNRNKLSRQELIAMLFQLEQLTKSGVPLIDGLKDLRDSAPPSYYQEVLSGIVESIEGGKKFSSALSEFKNDFDTVFVSLIAVGEESGELPTILHDMGNTLRWLDDLMSKTAKIMIYPVIVAMVVLLVTIFLMVYLVPDIISFITDMGTQIPLHTQLLIHLSGFLTDYFLVFLFLPFLLYFFTRLTAKKSKRVRRVIDSVKLKTPIFGGTIFKIKLARFASYMALLYSSGITVLRSLEICRALVDNTVMEEAIQKVEKNISEGTKISDSFAEVNFFPPIVIRMVRVGENSGNMDDALLNVSAYFNRQVQETIDKIEPAISPILTIVMAVILGWIMVSVLGPVWDAIGTIGA